MHKPAKLGKILTAFLLVISMICATSMPLKSAKICAIFIDIVKSTDKVTKLHESDIELCLARFLDSCLTTFLKYDLTIDKFHGDGLLAFSNMPMPREDYIERTCMAALEAVSAIKNDKEIIYCQRRVAISAIVLPC